MRGMAGVKEASVTIGERTIRVAVANRLSNARQIAERVKQGNSPWDFIEIMACPGGCAGGGGQLFGYDPERVEKRIKAIYALDKTQHGPPVLQEPRHPGVYKDFFGEPGSHKAHELLHTEYGPAWRTSSASGPVAPGRRRSRNFTKPGFPCRVSEEDWQWREFCIVDDDTDLLEGQRLFLEKNGYTVQTALTIEEGLARAREISA